jgi:hypothetical protein
MAAGRCGQANTGFAPVQFLEGAARALGVEIVDDTITEVVPGPAGVDR